MLGVRLHKFDEIERDYNTLKDLPNSPIYLQEALGDYRLAQGSPHQALATYEAIVQQYTEKKQPISDGLFLKMSLAASDAGKFALAQQYLEKVKDTPYVNDYTRTSRVVNPSYDERYFGLARFSVMAW